MNLIIAEYIYYADVKRSRQDRGADRKENGGGIDEQIRGGKKTIDLRVRKGRGIVLKLRQLRK